MDAGRSGHLDFGGYNSAPAAHPAAGERDPRRRQVRLLITGPHQARPAGPRVGRSYPAVDEAVDARFAEWRIGAASHWAKLRVDRTFALDNDISSR